MRRTKALVMTSMLALGAVVYALSGYAGASAPPLLLAATAFVALTLTGAPRAR